QFDDGILIPRTVLPTLVGFALALPLAAIEARAQAPSLTTATQSLLQQADAAYSAGERERAARLYRAVLAYEPSNSRAVYQWARQRAQRYPEAARAYAQSLALKPDERTRDRLESVLAESTFALRPYLGRSDDSDGNKINRWGLNGDWQFTERSRLGLHVERADVRDASTSGTADEFALIANWRPLAVLKLDGLAG